ncbi:papilin-like [Rhipicephalus sanguineus]|uniref:papilin-like n=1 Tax=Rhipicephalus sanguineus TaxID=34632 RepID=UPI0020C3D2CD|nr:papilin-like [Rhipicephalus sanguineus]
MTRHIPPAAGTSCMLPLLRACARGTNDSSESSGLSSSSPWFFVRSRRKGHCVQWNPDQVCLGLSRLHFDSLSLCQAYCEKDAPNARCTQPIETGMLHCSGEDFQEGRKKKWWYYDSLSRSCRPWEHVCLENTYASLRACAAACLRQH